MLLTTPEIQRAEIRQILSEFRTKDIIMPEPKSVTVEAGEDHDGDPVYYMTVTFAKQHSLKDIPWKRVGPLVRALERRVLLKSGLQIPVISTVSRLAEKLPKA